MKGSKLFRQIKADRTYLLKSYLKDMILMSVMILLFLKTKAGLNLELTLPFAFIIIPFAVMNGLIIASLLHNTSHNNIRNTVFNRVIGEYCGYWVLYGYTNFVLIHFLHHQYSDEELDPVNPKGMSFIVFLTAPMRYMIRAAKKFLFKMHGQNSDYKKIMSAQTIVFHLNLLLRLILWYLLLGKSLFLLFFIPGFVSIVAVFAHINYICHKQTEKGVDIQNLNHNLYYKIANFFTMGGYYHKNHHINMRLFDPRDLEKSRSHSKIHIHAINRL